MTFTTLYLDLTPGLTRLLARMGAPPDEVEDLVSQTWLKAWANRDRVDAIRELALETAALPGDLPGALPGDAPAPAPANPNPNPTRAASAAKLWLRRTLRNEYLQWLIRQRRHVPLWPEYDCPDQGWSRPHMAATARLDLPKLARVARVPALAVARAVSYEAGDIPATPTNRVEAHRTRSRLRAALAHGNRPPAPGHPRLEPPK